MFDRSAPISDIMTTKVKSIGPNTTMDTVNEIFSTSHFHHLPVVEEECVVGIISSKELYLLKDHFTLFKNRDAETTNNLILRSLLAKEVMTKNIVTVKATDTVDYAVDIFRENLFHALPVVDEEKKLVGIVTPYDIMTWAFRREPSQLMRQTMLQ